jgi:hypothetical protein
MPGEHMNLLKRIFVFAVATAVLVYLVGWTAEAFGIHSPLFAFLANWLVMAWVAVIGQVWEFRMPERYYRLRTFEHEGRSYEYLGVHWFKKLVRHGPFTIFAPTLRLQRKITELSGTELTRLEGEMCKTEAGHLAIGLIVILMAAYTAIRGWWDAAGWLLLFNIPLNIYPLLLQRYNRAKLQPLLEKVEGETI